MVVCGILRMIFMSENEALTVLLINNIRNLSMTPVNLCVFHCLFPVPILNSTVAAAVYFVWLRVVLAFFNVFTS